MRIPKKYTKPRSTKMQKIVQKGAYETTTGKLQKTENLNSGGTGKTLKRG